MRPSIAAVAACLASAHAFKDTSPFILASSSPFPSSLQSTQAQQLQSVSGVLNTAKEILGNCDQDIYYFVHQRDVNAAQLSNNALPRLKKALLDSDISGRYSVSEVIDFNEEHFDQLVEHLETRCKATVVDSTPSGIHSALDNRKNNSPLYARWNYGALPELASERKIELANNDAQLNAYLRDLPKDHKYTIIYTTTPPFSSAHENVAYEPIFEEPVHMDLKRNLLSREEEGEKKRDTRPLFEKYQFLTPGLFMGILVSLLLLAILSVGISALTSLEVSYKAFEKEMGPAAQKKQ